MDILLLFRAVGCDHVWCKKCSKRYKKLLQERLQQLNWRKVRHIRLSLDRKLFKDEIDAYDKCKKSVSYFIQDLKRKYGIKINRWVRIMEFHNDGFLHYHLIVEKKDKGYIGQNIIEEVWKKGFCREYYFKNYKHWLQFTGYFEKHGYFGDGKDKGHQEILPKSLYYTNKIIRRFVYSQDDEWKGKRDKSKNREYSSLYKRDEKDRIIRRTNFERIENCGTYTTYSMYTKGDSVKTGVLNVSLKEIRKIFPVEYKERMGLYAKMYKTELRNLIKGYSFEGDILWQI